MAAKKEPVPCSACGGRGVVSFGTDDVKCDACKGTGTVKG